MGHGIELVDQGIVWGDTWHRKEQYKRINRPIEAHEIKELFDYEIKHIPTAVSWGTKPDEMLTYDRYGKVSEEERIKWERVPGVYALGRPDHQIILNKCVSSAYTLLDMNNIVSNLYSQVCQVFTDNPIYFESAGTLYNGAIQFVSLVIDRSTVHGDDSPTLTRYMISNNMRHGGKGIEQTFNTVRVVCDNTRGMAISHALYHDIDGSHYRRTKHYADCNNQVLLNIREMWILKERAQVEKMRMDNLAKAGNMSVNNARLILKKLFPDNIDPETGVAKVSKKGKALGNTKKQEHIIDLWQEGQEGIHENYQDTGYAFFNAITNVLGRENGKFNSSTGVKSDVDYDNIAGARAVIKERALSLIEESMNVDRSVVIDGDTINY